MNETEKIPFSKYLKDERTSRRLSRKRLARESGVSSSAIDSIERGKYLPSFDAIEKLNNALGRFEKIIPEHVSLTTTEAA